MALKPMNLIGTVNILDRGDGPAQEVLSRTARNRAQRKQDETRNELNKITDRVDKTLGQFELVSKSEEESRGGDDAEMKYVSDVDELYDILSDQIKKRKYQQQVTVFIVGYQNASTSRLKLMQQVNEFFNETTQRWEDGDLNPTSPDIDLEEAEKVVSDTLDTAKDLTQKISDINKEMMDYMYQYANAKAGNKRPYRPQSANRKKMEKALSTAKEDLQLMSEKIVAAQKELDEKDEKIQMLYKQIEVKSMEAQKFKTAAEVAKKSLQATNAKEEDAGQKDKEIRELQKKVDMLTLELAQKDASRESSQREMLSTGRENEMKIKELEDRIAKTAAEHTAQIRDITDYNDRQLTNIVNANKQELQELKAKHEQEIEKLKQGSDKQVQELSYKVRDFEKQNELLNGELVSVKSTLQSQLLKEADLINEKEALLKQVADLSRAPASFRTVSVASSHAAESIRSDIDQDARSKAGGKKKGKSVESIPDDDTEAAAPVLRPESAEVNLPDDFDNEEKWASYPMTQAQSAFTKYRQYTHGFIKKTVTSLEKRTEKKVNTLKGQFHEHKSKWHSERALLIKKIEVAQKIVGEAEKEADGVLAQLEEYVEETEQQEKEEGENALKRQAQVLATKKSPTPDPTPTPDKASVPSRGDLTPEVEATPDEELLQQTDDAKAELKSRDGQSAASTSRKGRRSVTFNEDVPDIKRLSSRESSVLSNRHQIFERVITNIRNMMAEDSLDVVQQNALALLRKSFSADLEEVESGEHSLAMFSLASQISAESVYLGYKPDSLFSTILSMYYRAVEEYSLSTSKPSADDDSSGPIISDLTKLLAAEHAKSPGVVFKSDAPQRFSPEFDETDSAKVRFASAGESNPPKTSTTNSSATAQRTPAESELENDKAESGRSTPHSRLSNKFRTNLEITKQTMAERRSTSPRIVVPDKASFEDAELDENAELDFDEPKMNRSTSIGSSLNAAAAGSGSAARSGTQTGFSSSKTAYSSSVDPSVPGAQTMTPHAPSLYEKGTSVTPLSVADRPTSYSVTRSPEELVSSEAATHFPGEPLVTEYLKLYSSVLAFKDGLAKILLDKDMMSSSQVLSELESKHVDISRPIIPQIEELNQSCAQLLDDCGLVVSDALTAAFREDYNVSSVVSGVTSYVGGVRSRSGSYGMAPAPPTTSPSNKRKLSPGIKNTTPLSVARHTPADTASFSELQQTLRKLQEDFDVEVQNHQDDLNHNTAMVMELQDTVAELRRELAIVKEQAEARESAEQASDQESSIMFTRLDAERNAKNLKRAVNNNKLTEEQYNEAVDKMDEYVSLPARRLSELVRKFVHHKNMMRIEDIIKNREDLEETDVVMLEKMENLQNKRTQRWMNKMDALAEKRAELANELMLSLEDLEQESGIFMIKPMFSYRGAIFSNAKPFRSQKVKEGPATRMGVPVPSQPEESSSARSNPQAATDARWATLPRRAAGTWNLASSMPSADDADISTVNIPRILELDVNRMMYGQNQVSVKSTPLLSNDRLVNAANSSTRSYVTVNRPAASYTRPASSGVPVTSKSTGNLPDGALKRSESAEMSGRLHSMPPLPPIARTNTLAAPDTAERLDTGRDSSVNASRLAREFTDDSIHLLPTHVTRVVTKSISSHSLVQE